MLLEAKSRVHGSHQRRRRTASGGGNALPAAIDLDSLALCFCDVNGKAGLNGSQMEWAEYRDPTKLLLQATEANQPAKAGDATGSWFVFAGTAQKLIGNAACAAAYTATPDKTILALIDPDGTGANSRIFRMGGSTSPSVGQYQSVYLTAGGAWRVESVRSSGAAYGGQPTLVNAWSLVGAVSPRNAANATVLDGNRSAGGTEGNVDVTAAGNGTGIVIASFESSTASNAYVGKVSCVLVYNEALSDAQTDAILAAIQGDARFKGGYA